MVTQLYLLFSWEVKGGSHEVLCFSRQIRLEERERERERERESGREREGER